MSERKIRPELMWLLLLGVLLAAVVIGGAGFLMKKYTWAQDRLRDIEPRHAVLKGLLQQKDQLTEIQGLLDTNYARYVYPAKADAGQAGNEALQRVREMANGSGLQVVSSQVMPPREEAGMQRIGLNLRVEGEYGAVVKFLQEIVRLSPVVYGESLQLSAQGGRSVPVRRDRRNPQTEEAGVQMANAQLSLFVLRVLQ